MHRLKQIGSSLKWISKHALGCLTFVARVILTILVDELSASMKLLLV
jgi:hypothetical protein